MVECRISKPKFDVDCAYQIPTRVNVPSKAKLRACARTTFRLARTTFSYWRTIGPGRCCSCSTPPTLVRLLRVSAYRLTSYADDSQLYTWGPLSTVPQQRRRMELGVERIAVRMRSNRLQLNPEKTDFLWCATRRRCIHLDTTELSVCGALIRPSTSVRDLGVLLESDLF